MSGSSTNSSDVYSCASIGLSPIHPADPPTIKSSDIPTTNDRRPEQVVESVSDSFLIDIEKTTNADGDKNVESTKTLPIGESPGYELSHEPLGSQELFTESKIDDRVFAVTTSTSVDITKEKSIYSNFNSLQLSGDESNIYNPQMSHSKPQLLSSPTEIKKVESSSISGEPAAVVASSEKTCETLDIPMWCKSTPEKDSDEILSDANKTRREQFTENGMGSEPFNKNERNTDQLSNVDTDASSKSSSRVMSPYNIDMHISIGNAGSSLVSVDDIFNPASEVSVKTPANQFNDSGDSVDDENLYSMNFEMSGSSQDNTEPVYNQEENEMEEVMSSHSKNLVEEVSTERESHISGPLEDGNDCNAVDTNSYLKEGMQVFGLWNKIYYPGIVAKVEESSLITIHFHDDHIVTMSQANLFTHKLFHYGQKVRTKVSNNEYYHDSVIMSSFEHKDNIFHVVNVNDEFHIVDRNAICFTQIQRQNLLLVPSLVGINSDLGYPHMKDDNLSQQRKRRRMTEPILSRGGDKLSTSFYSPQKYVKYTSLKLFSDLTFFIIQDDFPNVCALPGKKLNNTDKDTALVIIHELKTMIENNGGVVIYKLHGRRDLQSPIKIICIANTLSTSLQFVYCVVMGIPILHADWIYKSVESNSLKPYDEYVIAAGIDITGEKVKQNYTVRDPYTPLNPLRIYVHTEGGINSRLLDMVLCTSGCERLFSCMHITKKSKKIPFNINNVDYILTMVDHVPDALWEAAESTNKKIVTSTWLVQCLINNQLLDVMDCPVFRYSKFSDSNKDDESTTNTTINEDTIHSSVAEIPSVSCQLVDAVV